MTSFELADLNKLANDCRTEYSKLPSHIDIKLEKELKLLLQQQLTEILVGKGKGQVDISLYSIKFTNKDGLVSIFPSRWLWAASVFYKYSQELAKYLQLVR
ncbi:type II restriction endonuclease subunit R, partial [Acinetobacter baumannii]|nr:type II restriction endonuclease subunit R [Acinetobacter baumannii]